MRFLYPSYPFSSHFCLFPPASILTAGLNHPRFCLPCHVWPPWTSVQASSHGDGTSRADISPQRYGPLMSMTSALTCLSFLRALTSSEWDRFLPWGLLTAKYGMRNILLHAVSRLKRGRRQGSLTSLSFPFCLLSKTYSSWLQIFRPFHVVSYPAVSSLGIIWQREGPHQDYSLQSFPSQGSRCFLTYLASNGTPRIRRAHVLIAHMGTYTSKQQNLHSWCKSAHKWKPQHPPWWKIESWSFCSRKLTDKPSEKWNQNVPILGSVWAWAVALCGSITSTCKSSQTNPRLIKLNMGVRTKACYYYNLAYS